MKDKIRLDEALLALQKSFSRVNESSAAVKRDPSKASAVIMGKVNFKLDVSVDFDHEVLGADKVFLDKDSVYNLGIEGTLDMGIGLEEES